MSDTKRIVEINGIKMEIDLRDAKVIENFKVGDTVKLLKKDTYGEKYETHVGMIVGFDEFETLPTIIVSYIVSEYSGCEIKYAYINEKSDGMEIIKANDWDIPYTETEILDKLDRDIEKKELEFKASLAKRELFLQKFGKIFKK